MKKVIKKLDDPVNIMIASLLFAILLLIINMFNIQHIKNENNKFKESIFKLSEAVEVNRSLIFENKKLIQRIDIDENK